MTKTQLLDFLLKTKIPSDTEPKEESRVVSEIFKMCWDLTPKNLYRYRFCNSNSFEALEKDKFLLTKPTLFNDPFDSLLYIDKERVLANINSPENKNPNLIEKLTNDLEYRQSQIELFGEEFVDHFLKVKPFKSLEEMKFFNSLSDKVYTSFVENLIDLSVKSLKQSSLVGCLSEIIDSVLMWSHYAQNHQGFALNYDFNSRYSIDTGIKGLKATEFADKKLFPVRYTKERFDATFYVIYNFIYNYYHQLGIKFEMPFFDKLFYYKILLFKSPKWAYEKEWRIIKQVNLEIDDNKPDIDFIENIRPKAIYMGALISDENRYKLLEIARDKRIEVFQMRLDMFKNNYKLRVEKSNDLI